MSSLNFLQTLFQLNIYLGSVSILVNFLNFSIPIDIHILFNSVESDGYEQWFKVLLFTVIDAQERKENHHSIVFLSMFTLYWNLYIYVSLRRWEDTKDKRYIFWFVHLMTIIGELRHKQLKNLYQKLAREFTGFFRISLEVILLL